MIWPMVEQAHFGTTRYMTLSLSVIHVPGNPMVLLSPAAPTRSRMALCFGQKRSKKPCHYNDPLRYQTGTGVKLTGQLLP